MEPHSQKYDVAIVGAGASGLACARELIDHGKKVVIIEGRSRIGGRVYTKREPTLGHAIELGAEFLHGVPKVTLERVISAGLPFIDTCENHFMLKGENLKLVGTFWEKLAEAMKSLGTKTSKDRSFADFVKAKKSLDSETRRLLISFVEGFHGANSELISEVGLGISEQADEDELNGAQNFRFLHGYDRLLTNFISGLPPERFLLKLNTTVKKISWNKKQVAIESDGASGDSLPITHAKSCVVTVPLGVLKASTEKQSAIRFDPEVPGLKKALDGMEMGHALRITFVFRSRFWEKLTKEPLGYLHAGPEFDFPTWWTSNPIRMPVLTAWQGGPRAEKLSFLSDQDRVNLALKTLSKMTGMTLLKIEQELQSWHTHNWTTDPFSLGAYSYIRVGGVPAAKKFSKPLTGNLFFAGEATDLTSARGTVNGAIDSGIRAARQILASIV